MRALVSVGFAALVLVACGKNSSNPEAAREEFSKTYSCPKERITATVRSDLKAFDLMVGARDKPPADIAADKGRLAEWQKRQQSTEDGYNRETVVQAKGCDHEEY